MPDMLKYLERIVEECTGKKADEIRKEYFCNSPLYRHYLELHKKDAEKGLVRLADGTTVDISF